jgi:hypothetical protein
MSLLGLVVDIVLELVPDFLIERLFRRQQPDDSDR